MDTLIMIVLPIIAGAFIVGYGIWKTIQFKNQDTSLQYPFTPVRLVAPAAALLDAINEYRAEELTTVPAYLFADSIACYLAQDRCYEMIENYKLSHDNWANAASELIGLGSDAVGENIAYGYATIAGVMDAWKRSAGHNKNMLNPKWQYIGISIVKDSEGRNWYCTLFLND